MKSATTDIVWCRHEPVLRKEIEPDSDRILNLSKYLRITEPRFRRAVREDLASHGILCGPEIQYDADSLDGVMTSVWYSPKYKDIWAEHLTVPYFHEARIEDALENDWPDKRNLVYLQCLTLMHTSGEEMIKALVELGGRSKEHIRLQTVMPCDRKKYSCAGTAMFLKNGEFVIGNNRSLEFNAGVFYYA